MKTENAQMNEILLVYHLKYKSNIVWWNINKNTNELT